MISKGLIVIFVYAAVISASPIIKEGNLIDDDLSEQNLSPAISQKDDPTKYSLKSLLLNIGDAIKSTQRKVFIKIGDKLNSTEFNEALRVLEEIVLILLEDDIEIDEVTQKKIESKEKKVAEAFKVLMDKALESYEQASINPVNAEDFKNSVLELNDVLMEIFAGDNENETNITIKNEIA